MRGIKHYLVFTLFFLTMVIGCAPKYIYVVQRDTPTNPAFMVLPNDTTYYSADVRLANDMEMALIKLGLSVVKEPILKSVEKKSADFDRESMQGGAVVENEAMGASKGKTSVGEIKEKFIAYGDTNADYTIEVNSRIAIFKIIKNDTLEILTVEKSYYYQGSSAEWKLYDLFTALGFTVKKPQADR